MSDRSAFDQLKTSLEQTDLASSNRFPLQEVVASLREQEHVRRESLESLGLKDSSSKVLGAIAVADLVAATATIAIRTQVREGSAESTDPVVDLLAHAEASRALWYDLYLGIKQAAGESERRHLFGSVEELVAEAASCAVRLGGNAQQLIEFARESGL